MEPLPSVRVVRACVGFLLSSCSFPLPQKQGPYDWLCVTIEGGSLMARSQAFFLSLSC